MLDFAIAGSEGICTSVYGFVRVGLTLGLVFVYYGIDHSTLFTEFCSCLWKTPFWLLGTLDALWALRIIELTALFDLMKFHPACARFSTQQFASTDAWDPMQLVGSLSSNNFIIVCFVIWLASLNFILCLFCSVDYCALLQILLPVL